jgi:hypothetical protein
MTKEEYITDLVSQNLTGKQIVELASRFGEEEVKTEVVADQTGAAVTTTEDTASESLDGKSLSDEEKAAAAVKAKEKEDRINSLYNKYNEDAQDPFFNIESSNKAVSEARNKTLEEKQNG